jgi:5-methylcytosine-specific restriction enzyme subunit McrC
LIVDPVLTSAAAATTLIPIRNVWHMFLYAWDLLSPRPRVDSAIEQAVSPSFLIATVLVESLERRMRMGIPRAYIARRGEISAVRGRIDVLQSVLTQAFERGRVHCRFEAYSVDSPRNRLIKGTLVRLTADQQLRAGRGMTGDLRKRLTRCLAAMDGVAAAPVTRDGFRRESPGRNDADDRLVLALCELLFLTSMPMEAEGSTHLLEAEREVKILRKVFERFVARFLERQLSQQGWKIEPQKYIDWPVENSSPGMAALLPRMQLDIRLTSPGRGQTIIIDTKFTDILTHGKMGAEIFKSAHLYQIYTYVMTQKGTHDGNFEAVLLYPAVGRTVCEHMVLAGMVLRLETIDLAQPWAIIESSLLASIAKWIAESGMPEARFIERG